jgi:large subunit ribosomal protein L9
MIQTNKIERSFTMEVILKEDVTKLGSRGDVVRVAEGYGRNYLLPKKLAIEATPANRAVIEQMKAAAVRRVVREKGDAEKLAELLAGVSLNFTRKSGEHDLLFGSVTSADIARELEQKSFNIDRRKIHLDEPLKHVGEFNVPVKLHKDVTAQVKVVINKEAVAEVAPAEEAGAEA